MHCPTCAAQNPASARSCAACGAGFPLPCPGCGHQPALTARFCDQCGHALQTDNASAATPPTPRVSGENRLVTVLFADLSGSAALTHRLHPEAARDLINDALELMVDAIIQYGGSVDRLLGDGALGLFGVPRARETDPESAVLAAMHIRSAARERGLDVSVGINTGEVYVGEVGSRQYHEQTVIGPVVNQAARLQSHAEPGHVYVGEATYRQLKGAFRFTPLPLQMKGWSETVTGYRLEGPRENPEKVRGLPGMRAPLIGRAAELEALAGAILSTGDGGGWVVSLAGEAGMGKSRLLAEARIRCENSDSVGARLLWLEGRCGELAQSESYAPLIDLLRRYLQLDPREADGRRAGRLEGAVRELVEGGFLEPAAATEMTPYLANLLALPLEQAPRELQESTGSARMRTQTFAALRGFFLALAKRQPVVLVLDDLHWADTLSLEFLHTLADLTGEAAVTLVGAYRPDSEYPCVEVLATLRERRGEQARELRLVELSPEQNQQLLSTLLDGTELPELLREAIAGRAHGNPFYLEELLRALVDRGVLYREPGGWRVRPDTELPAVPEPLQSLILSRVDRLPPPIRRVLEEASVAGQQVRAALLERLGHPDSALITHLDGLVHHGLLVAETPGDVYAFRHVLTRDTIYGTVLRRRRTVLHRRVAEALEALDAANPEGRLDELAHHYVQSGVVSKAWEYSLKAARRAERLFANREAIRHLETALQMPGDRSGRDAAAEAELRELLGDVQFRIGAHGDAERELRHALGLSRATGDAVGVARLSAQLADAVHWQGKLPEAIALAEGGLAALGADRCTPDGVKLVEIIVRSLWAENRLEPARARALELEELLQRVPYFDQLYMVHYALVWMEIRSRNLERAEHWLEAMRQVCVEHDAPNGLARCYHGFGDLCRAKGDLEGAAEWFVASIRLCERTGDAHLLLEGHLELAHARILLGKPVEEIEPHVERGCAIAGEMARFGGVSSAQALFHALGVAYADRGDPARAIPFLERTFTFGEYASPERTLSLLQRLYREIGYPQGYDAFRDQIGLSIADELTGAAP